MFKVCKCNENVKSFTRSLEDKIRNNTKEMLGSPEVYPPNRALEVTT